MSRLILAVEHPDALEGAVLLELEHLMAKLQAWANVTGDSAVPGDLEVGGFSTILGQHCCRLYAAATVSTGTETALAFTAPSGQPTDFESYIEGLTYTAGDTYIYLTEPGLYVLLGTVTWDMNAAGTYRASQFRVSGVDSLDVDRLIPSAAIALVSRSHMALRVTPDLLAVQTKIAVSLEAFHDSGANRTVAGVLSITKVA